MHPPTPKKVCSSSALKAARFLPVCALLIALPTLPPTAPAPHPFLSFTHTHTHISAPTFTRHFSTRAPPLLSPPPVAVSFCRFSPFLSICPFFKGELHSLYFNFIDEPPPGEGGRRNGSTRGTRPYFRDGFMVLGRSL